MSMNQSALAALPAADWNADCAAHLLRRAGFGGRPEEVQALAVMPFEQAVAQVVDFPARDEALEEELAALGSELALSPEQRQMVGRDGFAVLRARWLYRMVRTRYPLREKLTLFWHGHFATAQGKVPYPELCVAQLEALYAYGAGPFRPLLGAIAHDAAMQVFLDGRLNRRGAPNENFAREVLELFTLGVDNYSQRDVDELSRVFTGWGAAPEGGQRMEFSQQDHDPSDKTLFGETVRGREGAAGAQEGEEALDRILARPQAPRFLARKLLAFFAADTWPELVERALAAQLSTHELSAREGLRHLFMSAWFYAGEQRFAQQRSGIEMAVAAARLLGVQNVHASSLLDHAPGLGQVLFNPPSVAGWPSGRARVTAGGLIERYRMGQALSQLTHTRRRVLGAAALDFESLAPADSADNAALAHSVAQRFWQRVPDAQSTAALVAYLDGCDARDTGTNARDARRAKLRGLVHLTIAAAEFSVA